VAGDPRINRSGRPRLASEIQEALRDEGLAALWVRRVREGVKAGDPEMLKLYGKHAVPTAGQLIELAGEFGKLSDQDLEAKLKELGWVRANGEDRHDA
jgi:hypothetical protein